MQIGCISDLHIATKITLMRKTSIIRPIIQHPRKPMKKIKFLRIAFAPEITPAELPQFRGAIIQAVGPENTLFHNHLGDQLRYAYPLIQYKRQHKKPVLVCLEEGAEQIHALFQQRVRSIQLGRRELELAIESIRLHEVTLQVWDHPFEYRLYNWLALNSDHYGEYRQMDSDSERHRFLASILRGNILSMAKGLGWFIDRQVEVTLHEALSARQVDYKNTKLMAFDVRFSCNIHFPSGIGLGKGVAKGFGVVSGIRNNENLEK